MTHRFLVSVGVVTALMTIVLLAVIPVSGQGSSAGTNTNGAAKSYTPPRTPDGQPDLQGY